VDEGRPISYEAIALGSPVLSRRSRVRIVEHVLVVPSSTSSNGIVVTTKQGPRFVDRDQITDITTTLVRCALSGRRDGIPAGAEGHRGAPA